MPFDGQLAGKTGHEDILQNPDVEAMLEEHADIPRPDEKTMDEIFAGCPRASSFTGKVPQFVIAVDGSRYEASADAREPSRRVGYVKVGMVALDMDKYAKLDEGSTYVDPMAVNRLLASNALSMALPGANLKRNEYLTVAEGFRAYAQRYYRGERTTFEGSTSTLLDTLVALLKYNGDVVDHGGADHVKVLGCPNPDCDSHEHPPATHLVPVLEGVTKCDVCGGMIFIVDAIRIGEAFVDSGSNVETYGRLMLVSEHLLVAHWIRHYHRTRLNALSQIAFFMDGPLSISGESAKLHRAMMQLLFDINADLAKNSMEPVLIMGLTKSGIAVDHFANLNWPPPEEKESKLLDFAFAITDEYHYKYITPRPRVDRAFGSETYYGQNVLVRTARGHEFLVTLPYPFATKDGEEFKNRFDLSIYPTAGRAIELIRTLESDLYSNALVPVILAHEYASISLVPGGKVLDLVTARAVGAK
jgi:hypothetical protein